MASTLWIAQAAIEGGAGVLGLFDAGLIKSDFKALNRGQRDMGRWWACACLMMSSASYFASQEREDSPLKTKLAMAFAIYHGGLTLLSLRMRGTRFVRTCAVAGAALHAYFFAGFLYYWFAHGGPNMTNFSI